MIGTFLRKKFAARWPLPGSSALDPKFASARGSLATPGRVATSST